MKKIGKYEIIEQLGTGGMGVVYRAHDPLLGRDVAIKVIQEKALELPEMKERFYREARASGKLLHENLTIVHDVGEIDGQPYIVMEYLKGRDLRAIINAKEPLRLIQKLDYATQICRGLEFVHAAKIIHRDIKPENIKVLDSGRVKIMDFGIAKPATSQLTQTGMRIGTPWYMSPEQVRGQHVDERSDIFSFGVLLYELLMYSRPFNGDDTTVMYMIVHEEPLPIALEEREISDELQAVVSKCLVKEIKDRYASFSEIIKDLERLIATLRQQQSIKALLEEGKTLMLQQRFVDAIFRFEEVLRIDPNHPEAQAFKQECIEREKQLQTIKVLTGQMIGEMVSHYKIVERLGAGGMGMVYKAQDTRLKRPVALKFLLPELTRDEDAKRRFLREAQAASALDHPNICSIYAIDEIEGGQLFICMAYCDGETLRKRMAEARFELPKCLDIAQQIAEGLAKAHALGIIHRDLKPANIILTKDGTVKIVDFGLAKLAGATKLTKTGTTMGTLAYMSPEQIKGLEVDHRSDLWALGVILYELITGQLPFRGEHELAILYLIANQDPPSPSQINPAIPADLDHIVLKALQKPVENRFASVQQMLEALKQLQRHSYLRPRKESTETQSEIISLLKKGRMYFEQKEYAEALPRFRAALEVDPGNNEARELIAECEHKLSEQQQIERLLATAKRYFEKAGYKDALKVCEEIIALDADHFEAKDLLAKVKKVLEQADAIDKLSSDAEFYLKREKYEQAIEVYQKILSLDPGNKNATRGLQKAQKSREPLSHSADRSRVPTPIPGPKPNLKKLWIGVAAAGVIAVATVGVLVLRPKPAGKVADGVEKVDLSGPAAAAKEALLTLKTEAQQAGAETWAAGSYGEAEKAEGSGDQAFSHGDFEQANQQYELAAEKLRDAKAEAQKYLTRAAASLEELKKAVTTAQNEMLKEKTAAEKAGSKTLASALFTQAQNHEEEGDKRLAAGGREGLRLAQQAYADARDGYKKARLEVTRLATETRAKDDAETARTEMNEARRRVPGNEEQKRANTTYATAGRAESEGSKQFDAGDYSAAQSSFALAKNRYLDAAAEIGKGAATSQADAAKSAMVQAKSKVDAANYGEAKYRRAKQAETEGDNAYTQQAFDKAAERYQSAEQLYSEVALEAPKGPTEAELTATAQREIQNLISGYEKAFEDENTRVLKMIYKEDERVWPKFFKEADNVKATVGNANPRITGSNAEVELTVRLEYEMKGIKNPPSEFKRIWNLKAQGEKWAIVSAKTE